ncbi:tRNA (adenosine(37)-N6)-threonylcarbamoyltransferase complex ATPase subunit type 1 TsaE [Aquiflexum sp. TKW24L]|uniref:tRNA (adenosine(37)-N6)-threonylcarbamoyltransferase complex ATPase subunit type 1 TsaE n=1 Tax=Aquiflexum sp. TKW24L TaxID=2942212 RepID=UPI0020BE727C|nr:tRNA (adenosine(37)-N6)-threonylcarbamoyltransferase complex ATPase subunit type 1 TsaE [Aquiflexum sp. TKW24L]MCL6260370.1 tRNA (adenosine(37)-N6)-threonylcarbamoyltransferase complex ATPase subunit type 1 TsaE [Aquiflexum sp. TKW24L]
MEKHYCSGIEEIHTAALKIIEFGSFDRIWIFKGELGAGKTTLIKEIAQILGVKDRVNSPTFSLVNEYQSTSGDIFYHFDFYRIEDPQEVLEIGLDDYLYSGRLCWIEWAEKIAEYIPSDFIHVQIEVDSLEGRVITLNRIINGEANG